MTNSTPVVPAAGALVLRREPIEYSHGLCRLVAAKPDAAFEFAGTKIPAEAVSIRGPLIIIGIALAALWKMVGNGDDPKLRLLPKRMTIQVSVQPSALKFDFTSAASLPNPKGNTFIPSRNLAIDEQQQVLRIER